jgi:hypothetical protein
LVPFFDWRFCAAKFAPMNMLCHCILFSVLTSFTFFLSFLSWRNFALLALLLCACFLSAAASSLCLVCRSSQLYNSFCGFYPFFSCQSLTSWEEEMTTKEKRILSKEKRNPLS